MQEIQCVIQGRVQGVAYRAYAQDAATELGVSGYVRNLPDNTVYVCAQADRDVLKEYIEHLHEGSTLATVASVSVEWVTPEYVYDDFGILH